jgi:hypothetical protein
MKKSSWGTCQFVRCAGYRSSFIDVPKRGSDAFFCDAEELVLDEPHCPARRDGSADEEDETEGTEVQHLLWLRALRDSEYDRGKEREQ